MGELEVIVDRVLDLLDLAVLVFVVVTLLAWLTVVLAARGRRARVLWFLLLACAEPVLAWGLLAGSVWSLAERGRPLLGFLMPMPVPLLVTFAVVVVLVRAMQRGRLPRDRMWRYLCYVAACLGFYAPLPWSAYDARLATALGCLPIVFAQILYFLDDDTYEWSRNWRI